MDILFFITLMISVCALIIGMINPRLVLPWITKKMRSRLKVFKTYSTTSILSICLGAFIFNPNVSYIDKFSGSLLFIGIYCSAMALLALINPAIPIYFSRAEPTKKRLFLVYFGGMLVLLMICSLFMPGLSLLDKLLQVVLFILLYSISAILLSFIKPSWGLFYIKEEKRTRKRAAFYYGSLSFVMLLLIGIYAPPASEELAEAKESGVKAESSDRWEDEEDLKVEEPAVEEAVKQEEENDEIPESEDDAEEKEKEKAKEEEKKAEKQDESPSNNEAELKNEEEIEGDQAEEVKEEDGGFSFKKVFANIENAVTQYQLKKAKQKEEDRKKADNLYVKAVASLEAGNYPEAQKIIDDSIDLYDENGDAFALRGLVTYYNLGFEERMRESAKIGQGAEELNLIGVQSQDEMALVIEQKIAKHKERYNWLREIEDTIHSIEKDFKKADKLDADVQEAGHMHDRMRAINDFLDIGQNLEKTEKKIGKKLEDQLQTKVKAGELFENPGKYDAWNRAFHNMVDSYSNKLDEKVAEESDERKFLWHHSRKDKKVLADMEEKYSNRVNHLHDLVEFFVDTDAEKLEGYQDKMNDLSKDLIQLEETKWELGKKLDEKSEPVFMGLEEEVITIEEKKYQLGS
ncbi:hypothetical protein [Pseudalkalibacillus hwajinpoensis]|uniref:hypothetical protein n=1 Tax=Guptibacillus hwajinpoensis TaxID=208199 RepID=UPI001CFF4042|nr:hypothetical protein [Pseudalkalibacillus hwajinpoensis]